MSTNRIVDCFSTDAGVNRGVFMPFLTSGFPDLEITAALIHRADSLGAGVIELGIPFSDSIADGPVIQDSFHHVLEKGQTVEDTFRMVSQVRAHVRCGLVAMVSFSVVYRKGIDPFMNHASKSGFDGVILPDVPVEESVLTAAAAHRAGLCYVGLVAPTTLPQRRETIARASSGFLYQVAAVGTTGERSALPPSLPAAVAELRKKSGLPVCVGFGISTPEHVRMVCDVADGAIVGSAIVRRLGDALQAGQSPDRIVESAGEFMADLMTGVAGPRS